jgi:hypothetical protein
VRLQADNNNKSGAGARAHHDVRQPHTHTART